MHALSKLLAVLLLFAAVPSGRALTVYQNGFDTGADSLAGFTSYETATSQVNGGQLAVSVNGFDRGGVSLNTGTLPGYSPILSANLGTITWAFNVSNVDGQYNNSFKVVLAGSTADPYNASLPIQGYSFSGGGYVGNRMMVSRFNGALNTYQTLIDVPDVLGLGPLPQVGTVRITHTPSTNLWSLYLDTGTAAGDPTQASHLLGTAVDGVYTKNALSYFSLGVEASGTAYYDNVSIAVAPEPSTLCLAVVGVVAIAHVAGRSRKHLL